MLKTITDCQLRTEYRYAKDCAEAKPDAHYLTHWRLVAKEMTRRGLTP